MKAKLNLVVTIIMFIGILALAGYFDAMCI